MWRGRGFRWFGRGLGLGYGRGLGLGYGRWSGLGYGRGYWGPGYGMGRGLGPNFSPNCRWFPWLPRWWWANPTYAQNVPIPNYPFFPSIDQAQEKQMLETQLNQLQQTIENIKQRLEELEKD
ncbi:MAG: DUF5320 domain-containing protein [Candidatus Helarchaeota archaeon]